MRKPASLALDVLHGEVHLSVGLDGRTQSVVLSATQAREFAAMMLRAAEAADVGGQPHGHA